MSGAGGNTENSGVFIEETQILNRFEEFHVGVNFLLPFFGGPEAFVLLVDGNMDARGVVTGGFGKSEVGFGGCVWGNTGFWGLEEEKEKGEGSYGY